MVLQISTVLLFNSLVLVQKAFMFTLIAKLCSHIAVVWSSQAACVCTWNSVVYCCCWWHGLSLIFKEQWWKKWDNHLSLQLSPAEPMWHNWKLVVKYVWALYCFSLSFCQICLENNDISPKSFSNLVKKIIENYFL